MTCRQKDHIIDAELNNENDLQYNLYTSLACRSQWLAGFTIDLVMWRGGHIINIYLVNVKLNKYSLTHVPFIESSLHSHYYGIWVSVLIQV